MLGPSAISVVIRWWNSGLFERLHQIFESFLERIIDGEIVSVLVVNALSLGVKLKCGRRSDQDRESGPDFLSCLRSQWTLFLYLRSTLEQEKKRLSNGPAHSPGSFLFPVWESGLGGMEGIK